MVAYAWTRVEEGVRRGGWKYQAEKHRQTVKKSYEYHVLSLQSIRATFRRDIFYWVIVAVETINRISGFRRHEWSMQKHERNHKEDYQCEVNTFGQPALFRRSHFFEDFSSAVPKKLKGFCLNSFDLWWMCDFSGILYFSWYCVSSTLRSVQLFCLEFLLFSDIFVGFFLFLRRITLKFVMIIEIPIRNDGKTLRLIK